MLNVFIRCSQKILFNLHVVSYGNMTGATFGGSAADVSNNSCYMLWAAELLAAGIATRLPTVTQSGFCWCFSEFTSGFHVFCEKLCLIFLHTALGTHISWGVCNDGISDRGLFVRLNVSAGGWFSRLVTSRWMTYLKWCDGILHPRGVGFLIWATAADLLHTWLD